MYGDIKTGLELGIILASSTGGLRRSARVCVSSILACCYCCCCCRDTAGVVVFETMSLVAGAPRKPNARTLTFSSFILLLLFCFEVNSWPNATLRLFFCEHGKFSRCATTFNLSWRGRLLMLVFLLPSIFIFFSFFFLLSFSPSCFSSRRVVVVCHFFPFCYSV